MKKVVAFIGSPNPGGNTATLVEEAVKGAKDAGAEVKVYNLNELEFKGCQSCLTCRQKPECGQKDALTPIYDEVAQADAIIIGSPVYMWQVSSQVKKLFDRFYVLCDANLKPRFGTKKTLIIYSQANPNPEQHKAYFDYTNEMLSSLFGFNIVETLVATGSVSPDSAKSNNSLMIQAFTAGRHLVS